MMRLLPVLLLLAACSPPTAPPPEAHTADEPDVLLAMVYMQRYLEKTALAAEAGNWSLADRYAHELEEAAERMEGAEHDGVDLGHLTETAFLPAHERLEEAVRARDRAAYDTAMQDLVQTCNACHSAAGYGDVRIVVPTEWSRPFPSQDFAPTE